MAPRKPTARAQCALCTQPADGCLIIDTRGPPLGVCGVCHEKARQRRECGPCECDTCSRRRDPGNICPEHEEALWLALPPASQPDHLLCEACLDERTQPKGTPMAKKIKPSKQPHANGATPPATPSGAASGAVEKRRFHQPLPVKIDAGKVQELSLELAKIIRERLSLMVEKSEALTSFRKKKEYYDEREEQLATSVEGSVETLSIECVDYLLPTGEIRTLRLDTGEIIDTRAATVSELQEPLAFHVDEASALPAKAAKAVRGEGKNILATGDFDWAAADDEPSEDLP